MNIISRRTRQRGFSILEVVFSMGVIGVITVAAWQLQQGFSNKGNYAAESDMLARAENSITAFMARNARLPCPASDDQGLENCQISSGSLPWRTLQVADLSAHTVSYSVGENGAYARPPSSLEYLQMSEDKKLNSASFSGGDNILPMCASLGKAMGMRSDIVAYKMRSQFVPDDATVDTKSDNSSVKRVQTVADVWRRLNCSELIAVATRAHFNVANAAKLMLFASDSQLSMAKFRGEQAAEAVIYAVADLATQIARVANGKTQDVAMNCSNAVAMTADETAGTADPAHLAQVVSVKALCISSGLELGIHIGYLTTRTATVARAVDTLIGKSALEVSTRTDQKNRLEGWVKDIQARAIQSMEGGLYLQ